MPNAIAVAVTCFAHMHQSGADYNIIIEALELKPKTKKGSGFASKKEKEVSASS